jgi:hypothetical protein
LEEANMGDQSRGESEQGKTPAAAPRAPYRRPALKVYGAIAALTQAVGKTGKNADGGKGSMSKTS